MKKVIVCGGRDYGKLNPKRPHEHLQRRQERQKLREVLNSLLDEIGKFELVHGGATGADSLADDWAVSLGLPTPTVFPAQWNDVSVPGAVVKCNSSGRAYNVIAGFQRNKLMAECGADILVAFPGGGGTADMVERARENNIDIREVLA